MRQWWHKLKDCKQSIWPAIIWSAFIFFLLIIPDNKLPNETFIRIPHFDKVIHFILFGVFAYLWDAYLAEQTIFSNKQDRFISIFITILVYGLGLEYLQLFTGRQFSLWDLAADVAGILVIKKPGK